MFLTYEVKKSDSTECLLQSDGLGFLFDYWSHIKMCDHRNFAIFPVNLFVFLCILKWLSDTKWVVFDTQNDPYLCSGLRAVIHWSVTLGHGWSCLGILYLIHFQCFSWTKEHCLSLNSKMVKTTSFLVSMFQDLKFFHTRS